MSVKRPMPLVIPLMKLSIKSAPQVRAAFAIDGPTSVSSFRSASAMVGIQFSRSGIQATRPSARANISSRAAGSSRSILSIKATTICSTQATAAGMSSGSARLIPSHTATTMETAPDMTAGKFSKRKLTKPTMRSATTGPSDGMTSMMP